MEITFHGASCVRLKGKDATVVVDPPCAAADLKAAPNLVVYTDGELDTQALHMREGRVQEIRGAGEYEVAGITVHGVNAGGSTVMCLEVDGVRVVAPGTVRRKLTEDELDRIGHVDVLVVPVGGRDSLDATAAAELAAAIEPAYVIPLRYKINDDDDLDDVSHFAHEIGLAEGWVPLAKLQMASSVVGEDTKAVVLEARPIP